MSEVEKGKGKEEEKKPWKNAQARIQAVAVRKKACAH